MQLHVPTLLLVTVFVAASLGALLLFAWVQNRRMAALAWWGAGDLIGAAGAALLSARGLIPDFLSISVANALVLLAYGILWTGTRVFEGRSLQPLWLGAGAACWLAACQLPQFYGSIELRVALASSITALYALASAAEFWRGAEERLLSRYPAIGLLALHAAFFVVRVPLAFGLPLPEGGRSLQSAWFAVLSFETLLHLIAMAFLLLAMAKERLEREQRIAASTDWLTGVANRRAFLGTVSRELARSEARNEPGALILFDLDHFKQINDTHGHEAGDRVLVTFCQVAVAHLPLDAAFGRLGGEEFACFLPGAGAERAAKTAERIRRAFAGPPAPLTAAPILVSVSAGVASTREHGHHLGRLLRAADVALYRAKARGRDRTEIERPASASTRAA